MDVRHYKLNRNLVGPSVLHIEHPWEQCNTDQAEDLETIDELTAAALLDTGAVVPCQHCKPLVDTDAMEAS